MAGLAIAALTILCTLLVAGTPASEAGAREWAAERLEAERLREEGKLSAT